MDIDNDGYDYTYGVPLSHKRARLLEGHASYHARRPAKTSGTDIATKNYVNRKLNQNKELKYHITSWASAECPFDNPQITDLCNPIQGDAVNQRLGDRIVPKRIELRGLLNNASAATYYRSRIVIAQWFDQQTPTLLQVVGVDGATPSSTTVWDGFNFDQRALYRVLYDSGPINLSTTSATDLSRYRTINIKIKKKMRQIMYNSGATSGLNKLYAFIFSDAADAANAAYFTGEAVVYYTDKA